jgi:Glycosyl transferase family 90
MIFLSQGRKGSSICALVLIAVAVLLSLSLFISQDQSISIDRVPSIWPFEETTKPEAQFVAQTVSQTTTQSSSSLPQSWTFDPQLHERSFSLSDSQCSTAFPDFYREIDRAVQHRADNNLGNVTSDMLDISWRKDEIIRCMIYDGQVRNVIPSDIQLTTQIYIIDTKWATHGWDVSRALALLHSMHRALITNPESDDPIPNIEFAVNLRDWPEDPQGIHPEWVLTRHIDGDEQTWVMPDFGYWSWPEDLIGEYSDIRREVRETESFWAEKVDKAVWRGAITTNDLRKQLIQATKGQEWADVEAINWDNLKSMQTVALTIPEHCDYKYLIHTEGLFTV